MLTVSIAAATEKVVGIDEAAVQSRKCEHTCVRNSNCLFEDLFLLRNCLLVKVEESLYESTGHTGRGLARHLLHFNPRCYSPSV